MSPPSKVIVRFRYRTYLLFRLTESSFSSELPTETEHRSISTGNSGKHGSRRTNKRGLGGEALVGSAAGLSY